MLIVLLSACEPAVEDEGPQLVDLLEEVPLDAPVDGDDPTPERANTSATDGEEYDTAYLRGWVKASIKDVFSALTDPDVGVDRREVAAWTLTEQEPGELDSLYLVNSVVADFPVDYDVQWQHIYTGEDSAPEGSRTAWEKVAGTEFVSHLAGSVLATATDEAVDLQVVYQLGTIDSTSEDAVRYLEDFYASVVAASHGESLPTYE